jgi:hypothetical protein
LQVPNAPTIGTATAGAGSASVTFTAPSNVGGSAITGYTVISSPGSILGTGASSPITVSGLTNGTAYTFTVVATNAYGSGPASAASNSVTPAVNYIENVFSTYLFTGTETARSITNDIDLSTKGGLVWIKGRNASYDNNIIDTATGSGLRLRTNSAVGQAAAATGVTSFNTNGFSLGTSAEMNGSTVPYASWTFREQAKFFDIVTYTGDGTDNRAIAHNLGSVPGCVIVKSLSLGLGWSTYHRGMATSNPESWEMYLNTTAARTVNGTWGGAPTSTNFYVNNLAAVNQGGDTYVAYIFAHDAGGFGLTGTDNVISCGSYVGDGSGDATVNLGWEPQFLLTKLAETFTEDWRIFDTMRGWGNSTSQGSALQLVPNSTAAETTRGGWKPTATGFQVTSQSSGLKVIYIAIRRGPMKVPTSGTSVFEPFETTNSTSAQVIGSLSQPDMFLSKRTDGDQTWRLIDRLRSGKMLRTDSTDTETAASNFLEWDEQVGVQVTVQGAPYLTNDLQAHWLFRRAPSFFDEVCYTGTGSNLTLTHNLTVPPELIIIKARDKVENWVGWSKYGPASGSDFLSGNVNDTVSFIYTRVIGTPTATQLTVSSNGETGGSGFIYVAYLFATCAGVSKVGSYTGTGAAQTINCGFTAGSRFVLIKRTDSTGDWYVWDSARGIIAGNDPYLLLNDTAAEVTNTDYVDTAATGFEISSTAPAAINANGGTFIFLAIA